MYFKSKLPCFMLPQQLIRSMNKSFKHLSYIKLILNSTQKINYSICNKNKNFTTIHMRTNNLSSPFLSSLLFNNYRQTFGRIIHSQSFHSTSHYGNIIDRTVPRSSEEVHELLNQNPEFNPNAKLLKIAIIGVPNSGKSTLINELLGWRVCSVSKKVHTTQCSARAVSNHDDTQLVYLDTPGIVTPEEIKKYKLKKELVVDPEKSIEQADLIAVLHDVSNSYMHKRLHPRVIRLLFLFPTIPSILILNKVDLIRKKSVLLEISKNLTEGIVDNEKLKTIKEMDKESLRHYLLDLDTSEDLSKEEKKSENEENYSTQCEFSHDSYNQLDDQTKSSVDEYENESSEMNLSFEDVVSGRIKPTEKQVQKLAEGRKGWPLFTEVFMTSALDGSGIENLKEYYLNNAKKSQWIFSDDVVTDQSPQEIALMAVREKCLEIFPHNIPYELNFKIVNWEMSEAEVLSILIVVHYKRKNQFKVLIGPKGRNVKRVAMQAEQELRNTFRTEVRLRLSFEYDPNISSDL